MRAAILAAALLAAGCCCVPARDVGTRPDGEPGAAGPFRVHEFPDLRDEARGGRPVPIKLWMPDGPGPFPIVVLSHGAGGNWDSHRQLAAALASSGYAALCLRHVCSDGERFQALFRDPPARARVREAGGDPPRGRMRRALYAMVRDPEGVFGRPRDVSFAIDQAGRWNEAAGPLRGRLLAGRAVVAGHSFGAYTVLAACGARPRLDGLFPAVPPGTGLAGDLGDPRIVAGVALSPQSEQGVFFREGSLATVRCPLLCITGTKDREMEPGGGMLPPERRVETFRNALPPGGKILVLLQDVDHLSFSSIPEGRRVAARISPARAEVQRILAAIVPAFCDLHLKGDEGAAARLAPEAAAALCGPVVTSVRIEHR